jgi:excisionase family DNA binding protein
MHEELYYTVEETAKILKAHPNTVRDWCENGTLQGARKFGRKWLIPRASIEPQIPLEKPTEQKR